MADGRKFALSDDLIRLASHLMPALGGPAAPDALFDETIAAQAIHRHRIGPLLYAAALPRKDEIESAVFAALERSYQANVRQQVFTKLTLQLISSCFERQASTGSCSKVCRRRDCSIVIRPTDLRKTLTFLCHRVIFAERLACSKRRPLRRSIHRYRR